MNTSMVDIIGIPGAMDKGLIADQIISNLGNI